MGSMSEAESISKPIDEALERKKYSGFVSLEKRKGKEVVVFKYNPNGKPFLIFSSKKVLDFLERLQADVVDNNYALVEDKWIRAIVFASAVKFIKDEKTLTKFQDFVLVLNKIDLLYWFDHIRRFAENRKARDRVAKAMLMLFDFK